MTSPILDPRLLAALRNLPLAARQLAAGVLPGAHASRQPGLAREFSQYRAYQPGDDPRHIDWKLFARSDRYFLRESEIETGLTVRLILDATASMQHADTVGPAAGVRKFDAARLVAATLAYLAQGQGDVVGLHVVTNGDVQSVPPGRQRQPLERILRTLETTVPTGCWPEDVRALPKALAAGSRTGAGAEARELVVVLTDLHELTAGAEIRAALAPLRARGHELLLLHFLGRDEADFPFQGPVRLEEWETGETLETDAASARADWLASQAQQAENWRRAWAGSRFQYVPVRLDEPLDRTLRACLQGRLT